MEDDPFGDVLDLEETYYQEGYALGVEDGSRAGRIEGRLFGLEKGFEKFAAMGLLHGKASVWSSRIPATKKQPEKGLVAPKELAEPLSHSAAEGQSSSEQANAVQNGLPPLPENPRLAKHITTLHVLTELPTFSTANTEDAVADFDDRFRRAGAKVKVIDRIIGEGDADTTVEAEVIGFQAVSGSSTERKERGHGVKLSQAERPTDNMEDFGGRKGM
ncbi:uncharacterized protein BDZ99DRAFT_33680 [Mytilinidion resinicola]|uniref:Essential protein Yae1 N-terminal domain-containing protein n=1 Tax=Mytilinidion resinicola TaxID=574789 RepID=A0A6A6YNV2_9PEZI|nr:uncharacterized protein BDZ99DRAFT_33680 [Mytilinidion resinicola]KAF2809655.1 hypothetical protein BDZ99DRAFT_33680 [Mytilinidion resinicola]